MERGGIHIVNLNSIGWSGVISLNCSWRYMIDETSCYLCGVLLTVSEQVKN